MNAKTGKVIYEKNGHKPAYPASTTKIAIALVVLKHYHDCLDNLFTAEREALASISPQAKRQSNYKSPAHWLETDSSIIGIKRGEQLSLYDLLSGMMISSGDDAANVIAQTLGGTIPKYMEEVNQYVKSIGCKNTHFNNPHGLHHPEHVTTAFDLAIMTREGLQNPIFRRIVATPRYNRPQTNLELEKTLPQTNSLLKKGVHYYPKAIGVKTGYTQAAGKNLVAAARSEERELIVVALGYRGPRSELYHDVTKMFEAAFNEQKMRRTLLQKGEQKLTAPVNGARQLLKTYLAENLAYDFYPSEEEAIKISISWKIPPLPIAQGTPVGLIRILDDQGNILKESALLASDAINPTLWHRFREFMTLYWGRMVACCAVMITLLIMILRRQKTSRHFR